MASAPPKDRYVLSFGALKRILEDEIVEDAILQILGYKKIPGSQNNRFRLLLNDGVVLFPYAVLATQLNNLIYSNCLEKYTIFRLKEYTYTHLIDNKTIIICLNIEILVPGSKVNERVSESNITVPGNFSVTKLNSSLHISSPLKADQLVSSEQHPSTSDVAQNWDTAQSDANTSSFSYVRGNTAYSSISSLHPYRNKWVVKARVSYKTPITYYANSKGQGKYFAFHLLDETGEIRMTAFNEHAEKFHKVVEIFKSYIISNGSIKRALENNILKKDFEITADNYTKIEPFASDNYFLPMPEFNFTTIRQISLLPMDSCTDVIGICDYISDISSVITKSCNKEMYKRDISLIDKSKIPLTVTLWGVIAESFDVTVNHVIAIKNARVSKFKGLSLSATSMSMIYIDPNIEKAYELKSWFESLSPLESQSISLKNIQFTASENWKTLHEVFTFDNRNAALYHTTKATIVSVRKENCLYKACSSFGCLKKLTELDNMYKCNKCNITSNVFSWALFLPLEIADFTGSHWVTSFRETAENLIGCSSSELNQIRIEDRNKYYDILNRLNLKSFIFKICSRLDVYNDDVRLKSSILNFRPIESICYTRKVLTDIRRMNKVLNNLHNNRSFVQQSLNQ